MPSFRNSGQRRKVAVVEAARGDSQATSSSSSHVELTANTVAKLEQCSSHLRLQSSGHAASGSIEAAGEGKVCFTAHLFLLKPLCRMLQDNAEGHLIHHM